VLELLDDGGDLRGVVLELTEQAAVEDYDVLERGAGALRDAGAMVAIDDAGGQATRR
jgi:EAL domain-containing protein (putative c-di-GMP-specific phosphodiesterase class I)